jgi:serine/threonine protein kinase
MSKTCLMCGETFPDSATFCPRDGSALRATVIGDDLIGELLCDRYVVTDMLGEGGMGAVYLARDVRLPQQVAIKVLRDRTNVDPTLVHRFRQEAEAASRINHDRVARVTDFGFMPDGRAYLIMEYVNGRTLREVLDERGTLPPAEAVSITSMVAEGLNAAHRLGIVHRDLKPENVMVVDDADGGMRVKVLDFGIAKVLEGNGSEGRTAPGFVIGTPQWMSPEQLLGETLDGRSDIYALALLAFTMLTGERAFEGANEQAEMLARLSVPPRTLRDVKPDVAWPDAAQALLSRTLVRDPTQRPATALTFARELAKALEPAAVATPIVSLPSITPVSVAAVPQTSRRFRNIVIAGSALAVAAIGAALFVRSNGTGIQATTAPDSGSALGATANNPATARVPDNAIPNGNAGAKPDSTVVVLATPPAAPKSRTDSVTRSKSIAPMASAASAPKFSGSANGRSNAPADPPASSANASDELELIIRDADQNIGLVDEAAKRTKAAELIRRLEAVAPRLTTDADRGWAAFYIGTSRETLGETGKACASLHRAHLLASTSRALTSSSEKWLSDLKCPG